MISGRISIFNHKCLGHAFPLRAMASMNIPTIRGRAQRSFPIGTVAFLDLQTATGQHSTDLSVPGVSVNRGMADPQTRSKLLTGAGPLF